MVCPKCGKEIADGLQFCIYCGTKIYPAETRKTPVQEIKEENVEKEAKVVSSGARLNQPEMVERGASQALRIVLLLLLILILAAGTVLFGKLLLDSGLLSQIKEAGR